MGCMGDAFRSDPEIEHDSIPAAPGRAPMLQMRETVEPDEAWLYIWPTCLECPCSVVVILDLQDAWNMSFRMGRGTCGGNVGQYRRPLSTAASTR